MEIFRNIQNAIRGIGGKKEFPRTLTEADLIAATAVVTGKYNQLGSGYTVPAQQEYNVGQGIPEQAMNQGYTYFYLKNAAGTELTGKVRVAIYTANDELKGNIFDEEEEVLHGSVSDRQLKQALPVHREVVAAKDDKILVFFKPDSADTVSLTASIILLPVTNRWVPS